MNKEQLQLRIEELTRAKALELQKLAATYDGAIQDCQYWLALAEQDETQAQENEREQTTA